MSDEIPDLTLDDKKVVAILTDLMITSASGISAAVELFIHMHADGDDEKATRLMEMFNVIAAEQRKGLIETLFEFYGWLPPDILERSRQEPEP